MIGKNLTLLIVDDHSLLRDGLASLLTQAEPGTVVLQACDLTEGLRIAAETAAIDAVLLDLLMPGARGMDALAAFRTRHPALPVLVLTASEDVAHVRAALAAGALGYVPKSAAPRTLLAALRMVLAGDIYVPALVTAESGTASPNQRGLTARQGDVLRLLVAGQSNKQIARALSLSDKTVKAHVTALLRLLEVGNRTEAAARARLAGLV